MSKYAPIYRCLICGRIAQRAGEHEPLELDQHQAEVLAQGLADSSRKKPSAREKFRTPATTTAGEMGRISERRCSAAS